MIVPVLYVNEEELNEQEQIGPIPSRTYPLNFKTGRAESGTIDGALAVRQFIIKTLLTERYQYVIYSDFYGSELYGLIGNQYSADHLQQEIESRVKDAIIYDDRISEVLNVSIDRKDDSVFVTVTVTTTDGLTIEQGIDINI